MCRRLSFNGNFVSTDIHRAQIVSTARYKIASTLFSAAPIVIELDFVFQGVWLFVMQNSIRLKRILAFCRIQLFCVGVTQVVCIVGNSTHSSNCSGNIQLF